MKYLSDEIILSITTPAMLEDRNCTYRLYVDDNLAYIGSVFRQTGDTITNIYINDILTYLKPGFIRWGLQNYEHGTTGGNIVRVYCSLEYYTTDSDEDIINYTSDTEDVMLSYKYPFFKRELDNQFFNRTEVEDGLALMLQGGANSSIDKNKSFMLPRYPFIDTTEYPFVVSLFTSAEPTVDYYSLSIAGDYTSTTTYITAYPYWVESVKTMHSLLNEIEPTPDPGRTYLDPEYMTHTPDYTGHDPLVMISNRYSSVLDKYWHLFICDQGLVTDPTALGLQISAGSTTYQYVSTGDFEGSFNWNITIDSTTFNNLWNNQLMFTFFSNIGLDHLFNIYIPTRALFAQISSEESYWIGKTVTVTGNYKFETTGYATLAYAARFDLTDFKVSVNASKENSESETKIKIGNIDVAKLDECMADFYLFWQDRYGGYQSQPFTGKVKFSESFTRNRIETYKGYTRESNIKTEPEWTINSGWIEEKYYPIYESIFTSPGLILYDTKQDKSYLVNVAGDYTEKTYKNSKQLVSLELDLKLAKKQNIQY